MNDGVIVHIERLRNLDESQPGDVFESTEGVPTLICCPKCRRFLNIPHTVEVHEDDTVTFWGPAA